jgi:hypothetical protein
MKIKLFLYLVSCSLTYYAGYGQLAAPYNSSSRLIPPSPEAISINRAGFSDVNLYTGKMSYGIPLYTIEQNGFTFPISLAYIGGGGIKVEEVASSAGLGWSLNSTGVVSRVIRGLADDTHESSTYIGYMHMPDVPNPTPTNYDTFHEYGKNRYDGQPDLYNISVAGISAQFYIGKDKKVIFLDKTDIKIDPVFSGYELVSFKMKDLNGRTYYFESKEQSKSLVHESAPEEFNNLVTSSWYLTRVESEYGKRLLSFEYSTVYTNQVLRSPFQYRGEFDGPFAEDQTTWSIAYTYKCNLNKIVFGSGEINFIMSDSIRRDLNGDKWIKQIVVKNTNADTIKNYQFYHSYYPSSANVYRLKLDSLKEFSLQRTQSQTYRFTYDLSNELPNPSTSFAMDHWGYYNSQNTNASWEAKNRVKYYSYTDHYDSTLAEYGSANREPNLTYAKAGVLTKVTTPTGGQIKFNYELHTSADSSLPNSMGATNFFATLDFQPNYFRIELINEPFGYVKIQSAISHNTYSYYYDLYDSASTGYAIFSDTLKYGNSIKTHKLKKGTYYIKVNRQGTHPDPSYEYFTRVYVDKETPLANKFVGGLRIRSMEMIDSAFGTNLVRNYYYNEDGNSGNSKSTGTIAGPPSYGRQRVNMVTTDPILDFWSHYTVIADGYYRTLTSAYPLGVTSGSYVGYGKVTTVDSNALKTEYQFTSFKDFPEYNEGLIPNTANSLYQLTINGKIYLPLPITPADERDFLRGKLKR